MKRQLCLMFMATALLALADAPALATPAEEQRIVDVMVRWADRRKAGDAKGAEAAAAEARGLVAKLRPDLAGPPPAPRSAVFGYILQLAASRPPGARSSIESAFLQLQTEDTRTVLYSVRQALEQYRLDRGDFPKAGEPLAAALADPRNPYLQVPTGAIGPAGELLDGWGRSFLYARGPEGTFVIYSLGPNGRDDGGKGDDILPPR